MLIEGTLAVEMRTDHASITTSSTTYSHLMRNKSITPGDLVSLAFMTDEGSAYLRAKISAGRVSPGFSDGFLAFSTRNAAGNFVEAFRINENQGIQLPLLNASMPVFTDSNKVLGSGTSTGTGTTVVLQTSPTFAGNVRKSTTYGITASTTQTQAGGTALVSDINILTTVANANDAVTLPSAVAGMIVYICNSGTNTVQIFPALGDRFDSLSVNSSITLAAGITGLTVRAGDNDTWYR